MNEYDRPYHPVANLFPLMQGEEFDALKVDIAANGLLEPIWLDGDGCIIDGRNRHRACIETDTPMRFRTYTGESPVAFVVSLNLNRRHLTPSQRAALATDVLPMLEAEASARRVELGRGAALFQHGRVSQRIDEPSTGRASEQAASLFQTNRQYVSDAKMLKEDAPALFEAVKAGEMTIPQAKREHVATQRKEAPPMPTDKYRVFYADPPWSYGNSGIIGPSDNYGHVHRHYPSMTIPELCALGEQIGGMAEPNAVLFMWVTSPLLEECFEVIRAWGFRYKTSFVWDKVKHNYGHYNSVRHELLLVCTRGSCTPDNPVLFDSVQTLERTEKHSEKPDEFRSIIDQLYPHGKRLELFARGQYEGWEAWGNEF